MTRTLITKKTAARILGVSVSLVLTMDDVLLPIRTEEGVRIYDKATIERFAAQRDHTNKGRARRGRPPKEKP